MILAIEAYNETVMTEDRLEGVRAFNEKRGRSSRAADGRGYEMATMTDLKLTDEQRALKAAVYRALQAVPRRVLARPRQPARVPGDVRQRAHQGRLSRAR